MNKKLFMFLALANVTCTYTQSSTSYVDTAKRFTAASASTILNGVGFHYASELLIPKISPAGWLGKFWYFFLLNNVASGMISKGVYMWKNTRKDDVQLQDGSVVQVEQPLNLTAELAQDALFAAVMFAVNQYVESHNLKFKLSVVVAVAYQIYNSLKFSFVDRKTHQIIGNSTSIALLAHLYRTGKAA